MTLSEWASDWGVPQEALSDLSARFGLLTPPERSGESEAAIQTRVRLEASRKGARLFRNNVGATQTAEGAWIRYGLANDSKQMNQHMKSSDLIGIRPVIITPAMVGKTLGLFLAREVKAGNWKYTGTQREAAQLRFLQLIASLGGDACFTNGEGTI